MRKFLLALAAFAVALAAAAVPSGAGTPIPYRFTIDPTTGVAGTVVTFTSETDCPVFSVPTGASTGVAAGAGDTTAAISLLSDPGPDDFLADTAVGPDGEWTLDYTVPEDTPAGDLTFYAFCLYEPFPVLDGAAAAIPPTYTTTAMYLPMTFTVTAPATTTTTSTTSTSTTSTTKAPAAASLVASPTTVFPGDSIAVNATGFAPGSTVVITLESDPVNLGSFVADSAGKIATNVVVPADFPAGAHTLKLTGTDIAASVLVLSTGITVASRIQVVPTTAAPTVAPTTTGTLPTTGSSFTEPALAGAAVLVLGGSVAVLAARRRRAASR